MNKADNPYSFIICSYNLLIISLFSYYVSHYLLTILLLSYYFLLVSYHLIIILLLEIGKERKGRKRKRMVEQRERMALQGGNYPRVVPGLSQDCPRIVPGLSQGCPRVVLGLSPGLSPVPPWWNPLLFLCNKNKWDTAICDSGKALMCCEYAVVVDQHF